MQSLGNADTIVGEPSAAQAKKKRLQHVVVYIDIFALLSCGELILCWYLVSRSSRARSKAVHNAGTFFEM